MSEQPRVDSNAVNAFVASAKLDETSFSRGTAYGQTRARVEEMEEEYDARAGKVDKYLSHVDKQHNSPSVRRKQAAAPRQASHSLQVPDRLEKLKDDNIHLKKQRHALEAEVRVVSAKLRRLADQLKHDKALPSGAKGAAEFEKHLDGLIEQHFQLKDEELGLMKQIKTTQKRVQSAASESRSIGPATDKSKTKAYWKDEEIGANGLTLSQDQQLKMMKDELTRKQLEFRSLQQQIQAMQVSRSTSIATNPQILKLKNDTQTRILEKKQELMTVQDNLQSVKFAVKDTNREYDSLTKQYQEKLAHKMDIERIQRENKGAGSQLEYLREQINEVEQERESMQRELDKILRQPFFKKEQDSLASKTQKRIDELHKMLDKEETDTKNSRELLRKHGDEIRRLHEEERSLKEGKDAYKADLRKLNTHLDASGLSIDQIKFKLQQEDDTAFRRAMADLELCGEEPSWEKMDMLDKIEHPEYAAADKGEAEHRKSLQKEVERLKNERKVLAAELQKSQDLLKQQADIDKQNLDFVQEEIKQYHTQIQKNKEEVDQCRKLYGARHESYQKLQQTAKDKKILTADNLGKLGVAAGPRDQDAMSEFSVLSNESDIGPYQNVLDLRVARVELNSAALNHQLGMKNAADGAIQTFVTVDFFNHDTKYTDVSTGYKPQFDTIFSFKNTVDDFYLKYLTTDSILVEVFTIKGGGNNKSEKVGEARLPLDAVLQKNTGVQAQDIMLTSGKAVLGQILYRTRMRNSLEEALKWFRKTSEATKQGYEADQVDEVAAAGLGRKFNKKIFEISVIKCTGLRRADEDFDPRMMRPFFSFDFYTFEYRSPTGIGSDPTYEVTKRYEIEDSKELQEYMKYQFLKIDFIDESVALGKAGDAPDYVGSVRIPLRELLSHEKVARTYPLLDAGNREMGRADIALGFFDANSPQALATTLGQAQQERIDALQSAIIEKEVVMGIAQRFADSGFDDLDAVLDMLFMEAKPGEHNQVSKSAFKSFVLREMQVEVSDRDLDLFLRANPAMNKKKDVIEKGALQDVFEEPFRAARHQFMERQAIVENHRLHTEGVPQALASQINPGGPSAAGGYGGGSRAGQPQSLGDAYLAATLNDRDDRWTPDATLGAGKAKGQYGAASARKR